MAPANKAADIFTVPGLVAVITGGGSGLGLYAARALDANGAKAVYIVGRREQPLLAAARTGANGSIRPLVGDVTDKASLARVAAVVRREQGFVNLVFANAGVGGPNHAEAFAAYAGSSEGGGSGDGGQDSVRQLQETLFAAPMEAFTAPLHVNTGAVFYTAVAFLDLLHAGNAAGNVPQDAQVLVTTAVGGFARGLTSGFAYTLSKAAAAHLVKMLATAFGAHGLRVRVNGVAPGLFPSEMSGAFTAGLPLFGRGKGEGEGEGGDGTGAYEGAREVGREICPAARTGSEEDFAGVILFLASRAGGYVNGEVLLTDGGRLSQVPATY
ncbi:hypothetical protein F5B20DRAFT_166540 [Whalleya microplaca]|nr:hypothetical protein F5B20DRAFT_166540 [Whalleya microplaca]